MGDTVNASGGLSKGLKGFFASMPAEEEEDFGLLASAGEKRN
jgi:hypothetical protein